MKDIYSKDWRFRQSCMLTILLSQTALLFAQAMSKKIPLRKEGQIPNEVRRWSDFAGGHVLGSST